MVPARWRNQVQQYFRAVNACADADEYELALENFAAAFEQIKIPVLNHPAHVLASRCDKLHQTLNGIPGLSVPKSVRFKPRTPEDFQNTFTSEEFEYPVDVHMPASNDSKHRVSIESDTDWDRIFALPWGGQNVYMTQSLNYSVNDGQQVTASFSVTPFGAKLGSVNAPLSVETERFYEKRLAKSGRVQQIAKDIQSRLPLDIFGIELGLQNDEFVLLSLSAAMAFEMPVGGSPSQRLQLKKRFREIERDIWKTLKYVTKVPFKIQLSL